MKRLVAVLSGLLVLPAFAEIAPIVYDEIGEGFGEEIIVDDAAVAEESTTEKVVVPVVQSAKVNPRNATASSRAASRAVPSGAAANSRSVSARNTSSSRNATQARTGTATASRTNATATRVASRPSRNAATTTKSGVTSRSAATNKVVSARAGSLTQTDTVNTPLYTGRVSVRSSSAMQARSPSTAGVSVAQEVSTVSTDISDLDELAQMTDYCKAQYMSCMDNFCNVLDDNQGRCSCSKNLKSYEKTETALKKATEALQDVAQQIQYIGLSKDQVETLFGQTEAELQMQNKKDTTQLKNDLDKIKDMIIGVKTGNATSSETGLSLDFSGLLMGFNIDSTGFDLTTLFSGTTNTSSISNQRGEQLYKTATARCKTAVLNTCQAQGVDISVITNSYDLEIDKQCIVYERSLNEANDNMSNTVRNAKAVLQKARLMVAQQKNSYDLRGCINALDSCMQDEFVCGADYENCLDPTGKYIVNGEIVNGSTPGKANDIADDSKATGLYSVWNYGAGTDNAWQSNHNLSEYVSSTMFKKVGDFTTNGKNYGMSEYLQGKIGYHDDSTGKNVGMCISVLNQCQDYTYNKEGKYITNNQVISEYLQRTLVQIKAAQDEMLATHAEDCLNDVASCLQQNNSSSYYYNSTNSYEDITDVAINACKSQIKTCMSTMGEMTSTVNSDIKTWIKWALKGENQGGENQGGENQGGENQGGENQGGENQGGENQGGGNNGNGELGEVEPGQKPSDGVNPDEGNGENTNDQVSLNFVLNGIASGFTGDPYLTKDEPYQLPSIDNFSGVKRSDVYLLCLYDDVLASSDRENLVYSVPAHFACFNIADEIVLSKGTVNNLIDSGYTTFYLSDTNMTSEEYCNFANGTWDTVCYCPSDKYFNKEAAACVPNNN